MGIPKPGIPKSGIPKSGIPKTGIPKVGKTNPHWDSPRDRGFPKPGIPKSGIPKTGIPKAGIPKTGIPKAGIPKLGIPKIGKFRAPLIQAALTLPLIQRTVVRLTRLSFQTFSGPCSTLSRRLFREGFQAGSASPILRFCAGGGGEENPQTPRNLCPCWTQQSEQYIQPWKERRTRPQNKESREA